MPKKRKPSRKKGKSIKKPKMEPSSSSSSSSSSEVVEKTADKTYGVMAVKEVDGLYLIKDVLNEKDELKLLMDLKSNPGLVVNQIHTGQEYGWTFVTRNKTGSAKSAGMAYDAKSGALQVTERLSKHDKIPFPDFLKDLWQKLNSKIKWPLNTIPLNTIPQTVPDHVIVNQYDVGDHCNPHVDDIDFWTDWVVGVSLESDCDIQFTPYDTGKQISVKIPKGSAYILTGNARYKYTHGISTVAQKRTSLTFRNISPTFLPC